MITLLKWVPQALSDCSCSTLNKGFECRPRDTLLVYLCLTVSGGWNHLHQWHEGGWRRVWRILWSFYGPPTSAGGNSFTTPRYSLDQHIYKERDEREFWLCFFLPSPARLQSHTSVDAAAHQRQGERKLRGMSAGRAFFVACFETVFTAW